MKYLLLILIFLGILIESTLYPLPIPIIFAFMVALHLDTKEASIILFAEGLALDFFSMRMLGVDSLLFLLLGVFLSIFRRKMHAGRALYRLILLIITCQIYSVLYYKIFSAGYAALEILSILMIFIFMERFFPVSVNYKRISL